MALATMIENLNNARNAYQAQLKEIGSKAKQAVAEFLAPNIPAGYAVMWTQYKPYFNDGDACTFSVHSPYLVELVKYEADGCPRHFDDCDASHYLNSFAQDYGQGDRTVTSGVRSYQRRGIPLIDGYTVEQAKALGEAWDKIPEDLFEAAFGDHTRCSVNSAGVAEVTEHEHD